MFPTYPLTVTQETGDLNGLSCISHTAYIISFPFKVILKPRFKTVLRSSFDFGRGSFAPPSSVNTLSARIAASSKNLLPLHRLQRRELTIWATRCPAGFKRTLTSTDSLESLRLSIEAGGLNLSLIFLLTRLI